MKKKIIIIVICILVTVLSVTVLVPIILHAGSRELIAAIKNNDIVSVQSIIKSKKYAVNQPQYFHFFALITDTPNLYPLQEACVNGNIEIVQLLLDNGTDVNVIDSTIHTTPLLCALSSTSSDRYTIAALLIDSGANVNIFSDTRIGTLDAAVHSKYTDTSKTSDAKIAFLKKVLPMMNDYSIRRNYAGYNLLENASYMNDKDVVKYLVEKEKFDVNAISPHGTTALMFAAKNNSVNVCNYLLENGANKSIMDSTGKTAYDYAKENNFLEIAELLKSNI